MISKIIFLVTNIVLLTCFNSAYALDFGSVSGTVTSMLGDVSDLLDVIAWVAGAGFAISAIIKYREHRQRPQSVPLGGPLIEALLAIILISFPFIMQMTAKSQEKIQIGQVDDRLNRGF